MKRKLLVFGILFSIFLVFFIAITVTTIKPVFADNVADNVTIDVNVTEVASIIVVPDTLNWTSVATGHAGSESPGDFKYLTVKNAGSIAVSGIYAYVNTLLTEPVKSIGLAYSKNFSAGGVITIKNETDTKLWFAGRIEWNWTEDIPNHNWGAVGDPNATAWGYLRNTSNDYVWVLGNGTDGRCNETGTRFSIETQVDLGTAATRTPDNTFDVVASTNDPENWGYAEMTGGPFQGLCVATATDCSKVYLYHYDRRAGFDDCGSYIQGATLTPSNTIILTLDAWVPNGVPAGFLNTTILTVYATSA